MSAHCSSATKKSRQRKEKRENMQWFVRNFQNEAFLEDLPESHGARTVSEGERQPSTSLSTLCSERKKVGFRVDGVPTTLMVVRSRMVMAPLAMHFTDKEKLRSLLWHGFDRFSRKLRREPAARSTGGSPVAPRLCHQTVHRTSSSRAADEPRRSYSSEENDLTTQASSASAQRLVGSVGSKRRHMFATAGKQFSMPAEVGIALHM
ncbi:hypothetical protein ANCDUO_10401 [Ancylostoma duodenale]|uniref:Uncharacterized protein n=1 Tax=Ancylostoma duodenale TaxID=51022 RepID=A0A0C2CRF1_9BILA|nr:hypothetical protein ANCDUO_10401 [Ancylostoma duodenale]